jgi:hypothetical protein
MVAVTVMSSVRCGVANVAAYPLHGMRLCAAARSTTPSRRTPRSTPRQGRCFTLAIRSTGSHTVSEALPLLAASCRLICPGAISVPVSAVQMSMCTALPSLCVHLLFLLFPRLPWPSP